MTNLLTVTTVRPTNIVAPFVALVANTKETKNGPKTEPANKLRAVVVRELVLTGVPSKFEMILSRSLHSVREDMLRSMWKKNGNAWREVDENEFSLDATLTYAAMEQESKKMNGESILACFKEFIDGLPKNHQETIGKILTSMAGGAKVGSEVQLTKLVGLIDAWLTSLKSEDEEDEDVRLSLATRVRDRIEETRKAKETERLAFELDSNKEEVF